MAPGDDLIWAVTHEAIELDSTADVARALRQLIEAEDGGPGPLATLARHLPIAVLAASKDGRFTVAQGAALDRLGLGHGELVGELASTFGPESRDVALRIGDGQPQVFDVEGQLGDTLFRYRCLGVPDGDDGGLILVIDLTSVLEAEREAWANQELIHAAIDASGAGLVVQDADGTVLSENDAARDYFGTNVGERVDDLAWLDPIHEDGLPFARDELPHRLALNTRVRQRNVMMGLQRGGDERRWVSATAHPVKLDGREAVMTSYTDITERRTTKDVLKYSDERFRLLAEQAPVAIFISSVDGDLLYVNPAVEEVSGRSMSEIRDIGWAALIHPDDVAEMMAADRSLEEVAAQPLEYRMVRPDGTIRWVKARVALLRDELGEVIGLVGTGVDITDLQEASTRLRESEQRTRGIVETAAEGIVSFTELGEIVEFNAAAERIFGFDSEEVIGQMTLLDLVALEYRGDLVNRWSRYLDDAPVRIGDRGPQEIAGQHKDGSAVAIEVKMTKMTTSEGRLFTILVRDLSESKAFERELEHLVTHDALTGLPNRTFLAAQLESALTRASRHGSSIGVLMVEIDRVKLVTEALGHRASDELILQAAARLRATADEASTIARFSNDQFVVVVEDLDDVVDAVELAVRVIEAVNDPFMIGADEAFVNATVGIAFAPSGMGMAETLVSNADVAMGRAKSSSASRYEVYDAEMRAWVDAQRKTEIALRHGIDRAEFELFYQPVVALDGGRVSGVEALVRWNHPHRGRLLPADFIPIAEDSGLIVPLGEQILRDAITQAARWTELGHDLRPMSVAINLSGRQLAQPELVDVIRSALDDAGADPSMVAFEITETVLLEDVDAVVGTLGSLKDLGVRLALDDFGTGYSSLTYLCRLPIDTVKVDRSFVSQLGTGSRDASIVEMVVGMARTLRLDVVAEGVETERQASVLRRCGCKYGQGFLFSEPQPAADIDLLLQGAPETRLHV